MTLFKDCDTER